LVGVEAIHLNSFPPVNEPVVQDDFVLLHVSSEEKAIACIHDGLPEAAAAALFGRSVAVEEGGRHVHVRGAHEGSGVRGRWEWSTAGDDHQSSW
jgi:hypothetical protein